MASQCLRQENPGHTLQPTALVHEAYLRLCESLPDPSILTPPAEVTDTTSSKQRAHFLAAAALTMRRVLVDHARRHRARKRGRSVWKRIDLEPDLPMPSAGLSDPGDLVELDSALTHLGAHDGRCEQMLSMRYFGGMTCMEIADHLGVSLSTVEKDMRYALAWLARHLSR
jgi:RNA polymerase sigma factor (TIGR02999 family)